MYHALWRGAGDPAADRAAWDRDPQLRDPGARLYAVEERVFGRQMEMLAKAGPSARARITFDDGHRSNHDLALPILRRLGLTACFFITSGWIGTDGFMSEEQIRALRQAGMQIGAHGVSHAYFSDLSPEALEEELVSSKRCLEQILGEPIDAVALPGGRNHPLIRETARRAGYAQVFTSRMAPAAAGADPFDLPRIAITRREDDAFFDRLLAGDFSQVEAMARSQRRRALAKRLLGNALYDRIRGLLIAR
jgi:peptidoglycan/xylan/chitin deacetylase (PgdA/CDA1 family)